MILCEFEFFCSSICIVRIVFINICPVSLLEMFCQFCVEILVFLGLHGLNSNLIC